MDTIWSDLKYAVRTVRTDPWFTAIAAATLALGLGANTAIFSVIHTLLLKPLPFAEPESLVYIQESNEEFEWMSVAYPNFLDWREQTTVFEHMTAHRLDTFNFTGTERPERVLTNQVSASMFPMLRVEPLHGRAFTEGDDRPIP
jgi:hypothetical protein